MTCHVPAVLSALRQPMASITGDKAALAGHQAIFLMTAGGVSVPLDILIKLLSSIEEPLWIHDRFGQLAWTSPRARQEDRVP